MKGDIIMYKEKGYKKQQRIDFSNRLKEIIEMRGLKIYDIAIKTKIPEQMISEYASGKYVPRPRNLVKLSEALGVNHLWLSGESDQMIHDEAMAFPEGMSTDTFLIKISNELVKRNNTQDENQKIYYEIFNHILRLNTEGLAKANFYLEDLTKIEEYKIK